jgi:alanine dehydrogenase
MTVKIALIREEKEPADLRVALSPRQCVDLQRRFPEAEVLVQSSAWRCFEDDKYRKEGIQVVDDVRDCDILMGIKEIPKDKLIAGKTYLFFSHTIKKQPYNRSMLRTILERNIRLVDYECLTWENGSRILGFGRFAGIVGMHNGFITWGRKGGLYEIKPAYQCKSYEEVKQQYKNITLPAIKIALCGDGRVAHGALELLHHLRIREVTKREFLEQIFQEPVFVHLRSEDYYARKDGKAWDKSDFYHNPEEYVSTFHPYYRVCDMMVNAIFWHQGIPAFFTKEDMKQTDFNIKVIADITCDLNGPLPCTQKATTIAEPVYGYHPISEKITTPYLTHTVDVMAVGNLPCELPSDASMEFGESMLKYVMPHLLSGERDDIIDRATIAVAGKLTERYLYLTDYVE